MPANIFTRRIALMTLLSFQLEEYRSDLKNWERFHRKEGCPYFSSRRNVTYCSAGFFFHRFSLKSRRSKLGLIFNVFLPPQPTPQPNRSKVFELQQSNQGYRESLGVKEVQINAKRKYSTELFWRNLILKFALWDQYIRIYNSWFIWFSIKMRPLKGS